MSTVPLYAGAYSPPELSSYLRTASPIDRIAPSAQRIRSWAHRHVISPHGASRRGRFLELSFDDLTTSQVVAILRDRAWSIRRIEEAERVFAKLLGVERPFTNRALWTAGPDLFARVGGALVAGTRGGQIAMEGIVNEWLHPVGSHFTFDDRTGRARAWRPVARIELDPMVQFGAPCLEGTSIPTSALWSYVHGGDSAAYVARSYGLRVADVERAVAWEDLRLRALETPRALSA